MSAIGKSVGSSFGAVVVFSAFSHVLNLASPLFIMHVYDRVLSTRSVSTLVLLATIFSLLLIVAGILDFIRSRILVRLANAVELRLIPHLAQRLFGRTAVSGAADLPLEDLQAVRIAATGVPGGALLDMPWSVLYLLLAFLLHPVLGWSALGCAAAMGLLVVVAQRRHVVAQAHLRDVHASGTAQLRDYGTRADLARSLGVHAVLAQRWERQRRKETAAVSASSDQSAWITNATKTLRALVQIAILAVAAWLSIRQEITAGAIFASSIIVSRALLPLEAFASSWGVFARGYAAIRRLAADSVVGRSGGRTAPPRTLSEVAASGLYVPPAGTIRPFLKEVSFNLRQGELVVLAGPVGSGKTLVCKTVAGALMPAAGVLRLDGVDAGAMDPADRARCIGYLPQSAEFLPGTITENLTRFDAGVSLDQVMDAVRGVGLHEVVSALPQGYDTSVHASGFSGGQLQLLSIARAFCGAPSMLVLDTPESNLDPDSLARVEALLQQWLKRGGLVLMVTHHPRLMRYAARISILTEGRIVRTMTAQEFFRRTGGVVADAHPMAKSD